MAEVIKQKVKLSSKEWILRALRWFFYSGIWIALLLLALDIVSKNLIVANLTESTDHVVLIPGLLRISFVANPNAAFGLGADNPTVSRIMYIIIAIIGLGIIMSIYSAKYKKLNMLVRVCLLMMAVGALGNLIDRLFYYHSVQLSTGTRYCVVDWIDFYGIWPFTFNIADASIVVGTIILIVYLIVEEIKEYKKNKPVKADNGPVLSEEEKSRLEEDEEPSESIDTDETNDK